MTHPQRLFEAFRGESHHQTYLRQVLSNAWLASLRPETGRWRPSARARRLGPPAIALERLIVREGFAEGHAVETVALRHRGTMTRRDVEALLPQIRATPMRRRVDEAQARSVAAAEAADDLIRAHEAMPQAAAVRHALTEAIDRTPPDDRTLIEAVRSDVRVSQLGRDLGVVDRELRTRLARLYRTMVRVLLELGVGGDLVHDVLQDHSLDLLDERGEHAETDAGRKEGRKEDSHRRLRRVQVGVAWFAARLTSVAASPRARHWRVATSVRVAGAEPRHTSLNSA